MEYTEKDYQEDLKISQWVFNKHFSKFLSYKQDLIQESLMKLWQAKTRFDETRGNLGTFKVIVSINAMKICLRKERRHIDNLVLGSELNSDHKDDLIDLMDLIANDEIDTDKIDLTDSILKVLKTKSEKVRKVVKLYLQDYNQAEISKKIDNSQAMVSRMLKTFKNDLSKEMRM